MYRNSIILILLLLLPAISIHGADTKQERNFIVEGNKLYSQKRYAEAETMYKKALTVSPTSEVARFNLASALIRQSGSADPNSGNTPLSDAISLLTELEKTAQMAAIVEKAAYDLGNISFNAQQYQQAIEHYKNALRKNPDNDKAGKTSVLRRKSLKNSSRTRTNRIRTKKISRINRTSRTRSSSNSNRTRTSRIRTKKMSRSLRISSSNRIKKTTTASLRNSSQAA